MAQPAAAAVAAAATTTPAAVRRQLRNRRVHLQGALCTTFIVEVRCEIRRYGLTATWVLERTTGREGRRRTRATLRRRHLETSENQIRIERTAAAENRIRRAVHTESGRSRGPITRDSRRAEVNVNWRAACRRSVYRLLPAGLGQRMDPDRLGTVMQLRIILVRGRLVLDVVVWIE